MHKIEEAVPQIGVQEEPVGKPSDATSHNTYRRHARYEKNQYWRSHVGTHGHMKHWEHQQERAEPRDRCASRLQRIALARNW
jgi:hypothetical protein